MQIDITTIKAKRHYQEIGSALYERILNGEFKKGDRLPPERDIAEEMQVSRSVVREAIIMLELQELVEVRKGSGVYVINIPLLKDTHEFSQISPRADVDVGPFELLQARQVIESEIARLAAKNINKNDIQRLRESLNKEKRNIVVGVQNDANDEFFHLAIAQASQNSVLVDIANDLWLRRRKSLMWRQLHSRISNTTYRKTWLIDHEHILITLQKRDAQGAQQAMWKHLENVREVLFKLSNVDDPTFDGYLFS